ncbi:hypothetical protein B0H16DRAFT_1469562 [Mycena metata]|uniref:Uncharacterized protein n=1 Tax=Mycena metata TaxID=1033252 RepID=A0AAD7MSR4_9AGAR|nr:hypothetical protein B0H16DRAFT_1469562 [Mycena metata]
MASQMAAQPRVLNNHRNLVTTRILEPVGVAINTEPNVYICGDLVANFLIQLQTFAREASYGYFQQSLVSRVFPGDPGVVGPYDDMTVMHFGKVFTSGSYGPSIRWTVTMGPYRQINTTCRQGRVESGLGLSRVGCHVALREKVRGVLGTLEVSKERN